MGGALLIAAAWLAVMGGVAMVLTGGSLAAAEIARAAAPALAVTTPFGIVALALWQRTGRLREAEALSRRLRALEAALDDRVASEQGPTLDHEALGRALSNAAREALDDERGALARRMAELAETQRRLDEALNAPAAPEPLQSVEIDRSEPSTVPASPPRAPVEDERQPDLPLAEGAVEAGAPDWDVIAAALDFPKHAGDADGFAALDAARRDRGAAELLRASEDALTLLAQHGLYMEDLSVRHAPAAVWRRFADGERGRAAASAAGVDDVEAIEKVRGLMKSDPVFRDTGMHLMRRYDACLLYTSPSPRD